MLAVENGGLKTRTYGVWRRDRHPGKIRKSPPFRRAFCWLVNRFLAVAEYVSHAGFLGLQVGAVLVGYFRFHGDAVDDL